MRSDLMGMPVIRKSEDKIWIIRAAWVDEGNMVWMLIESDTGELQTVQHQQLRMLVPQVMSSYSATNLTELFPDLLMRFGRKEIVAIWTLAIGFDGPLRERIKYGITAFEEGKVGELAAMRAMRDQGAPTPWMDEPSAGRERLKAELRAEILLELGKATVAPSEGIEPWHPGLPGAHRVDPRLTGTDPVIDADSPAPWELEPREE